MAVKLSPGKIAGLEAVSDERGVIAALALDQRGLLKNMLIRELGGADPPAHMMVEFKQHVAAILTREASSILLDVEYGLPGSKAINGKGLLLAYEKSGYSPEFPEKLPTLTEGWSALRLKEAGANAVKILVFYTPFEKAWVNEQKKAWVERAGAECRAIDIPCFLEFLSYDVHGEDEKGLAFAKRKPEIVRASIEEFTKDRYAADVLKLEVPIQMAYTAGTSSFCGEQAYSKAEAMGLFRSNAGLTDKPIVYLSAGVTSAGFVETLELAVESGVNFHGVLCGRATWQDGVAVYVKDGAAALDEWLGTVGLQNVRNVNEVLKSARPWYEARSMKLDGRGGFQLEVPEQQEVTEKNTATEAQRSNRRWFMLGLIFTITVINVVDRQTLSILAPILRQIFHLSNEAYGRIVSALQFGLMSGEFPMGLLMDRWGARLGLSLAVLWWSTATGVQVLSKNGLQFGVVRYWMGTGECGNYSGGMKTVMRLFQRKERTLAIGIFNGGSVIGSTIALPLVVFLLQHYGYKAAFLVPAILGFLWVPVWWLAYGKEPKEPAVKKENKVSSWAMLKQSSSWAVMACRFFIGPVMQFYWYWTPVYLANTRHMSMTQIGFLAWIPFFMGAVGGVAGGFAAGMLQRRGISTRNVRRITMYSRSIACIASLFVPFIAHSGAAILMIGVAILADNFLSANMFAAVTDLFPDNQVGRATGLTGIAGGLSGLMFPLLTGWTVDHFSYTPVFLMVAFMPLLGTIGLFALGRKYHKLDHASPQAIA